ncbi:hypothetical protein JL720_443 [Aureococcus anophagefferens]|nr:hypothetical protein JL720_443 [Aureococcus anophagefferens]
MLKGSLKPHCTGKVSGCVAAMGVNQSAPDQPGAELDSFSEIDENDDVSELMPRNEEAELAILNDFVEALIDVAPPTWPPMA